MLRWIGFRNFFRRSLLMQHGFRPMALIQARAITITRLVTWSALVTGIIAFTATMCAISIATLMGVSAWIDTSDLDPSTAGIFHKFIKLFAFSIKWYAITMASWLAIISFNHFDGILADFQQMDIQSIWGLMSAVSAFLVASATIPTMFVWSWIKGLVSRNPSDSWSILRNSLVVREVINFIPNSWSVLKWPFVRMVEYLTPTFLLRIPYLSDIISYFTDTMAGIGATTIIITIIRWWFDI